MATNYLILSLKISLLSLSVLSLALLFNLYLPLMSELPLVWGSLRSWLTPPYLYVIINFIIITIVASSRYQHKVEEQEMVEAPVKVPVPVQFEVYEEEEVVVEGGKVEVENEESVIKNLATSGEVKANNIFEEVVVEAAEGNATMIEAAVVEYSVSKEKPPVSARFGHRKIPKGSPEAGKSLKVSKPKRQETLENTWKMITEGRSMPLARHLKKSDTWETHTHAPMAEQVKKSETFNSRNNVPPIPTEAPTSKSSTLARSQGSGSFKLRKEPSLSQEELNRRVEAFINKFNEEMRLQRLESLNRYKEMVV